jgi:hypothetical protein
MLCIVEYPKTNSIKKVCSGNCKGKKFQLYWKKLIFDKYNFRLKKLFIRDKKNNTTAIVRGVTVRQNSIVAMVKGFIDKGKLEKIVSANVLCWAL